MKEHTIIDRNETISKYFKEVRDSELLTVEKEIEITNRIREGDPKAVNELVTANLKFVISIAKEYQGLGLALSDLISEGNYGLIKSAVKFDSTKGFKFITYAVYWIRQSIMQSLNDNSRIIRLPTNVIHKLSKLSKRSSTYEDIMSGVDYNDEHYPVCVSLNETLDNASDTKNGEFMDFLAEEPISDEIFNVEIGKLKKVIKKTLKVLDDRERGIIECYFGLNRECEPMTLEAIGDKYDLTKERIRQIKEKAIRRLRHNNDDLFSLLNQ